MPITKSVMSDGTTLLQIGTNGNDGIAGDVFFDGTTRLDDEIRGGEGHDTLNGRQGQNDLFGQGGNDFITIGSLGSTFDRGYGGTGDDTFTLVAPPSALTKTHLVSGGAGYDMANLFNLGAWTGVILRKEKVSIGVSDVARLFSVESILGTALNDKMTASSSIRLLNGNTGDDVLKGNATKKRRLLAEVAMTN